MNTHIDDARLLTDNALLARARCLADRERGATAELVAHLAEIQRRKLHLTSGYSSMFTYCRGALGLSESEAYNRIQAAKAARRFPVILDQLLSGAVSLTTVKLLARHLTADNHLEVLDSARGLSRPAVEKLVARLAPVPDVPTSVRKLPAPRPSSGMAPTSSTTPPPAAADLFAATPSAEAAPSLPADPAIAAAEARAAVINALSPDRYKLQVTISGETLAKLELVKDMIGHAVPSDDVPQILDRALTLLLNDLTKKRFAATEHPRRSSGVAAESHAVSAEVKRIVFVRDLGRCAFVGKGGHRCEERSFLHFHHVRPFAEGGLPTAENIELRCRAHNLYEWHLRSTAVRRLEEEWLEQRVAAGNLPSSAATGPEQVARRRREVAEPPVRQPCGRAPGPARNTGAV
jgi:hypothetical protein